MRKVFVLSAVCVVSLVLGATAQKNRSLKGTWCIEEEDVHLTFFGTDSVRVAGGGEDGVNGTGTYQKMDSMFVATLTGDALEIRMGYTYDWTSDSTLSGKPLFLTLNGDSLEVPDEKITMKRCAK